jgi:Cu+-exporting ATPase
MKILSASVAILMLSSVAFPGGGSLRAQTPAGTPPTLESVVIPVKGMSCMACVAKTKQALRAVPGVTEVEVKLSPGSATVKYDPAQVTPEKLASVIKELGYGAGSPAPQTSR